MERETQVATAKVATLWSTVGIAEGLSHIGINDWGDAAAMFAAIYSVILIAEWVYKKLKQ